MPRQKLQKFRVFFAGSIFVTARSQREADMIFTKRMCKSPRAFDLIVNTDLAELQRFIDDMKKRALKQKGMTPRHIRMEAE